MQLAAWIFKYAIFTFRKLRHTTTRALSRRRSLCSARSARPLLLPLAAPLGVAVAASLARFRCAPPGPARAHGSLAKLCASPGAPAPSSPP
eukprot:CAMPEP_0204151724 /NCGR_PEP_ID=MMETSP0361-20130328/26412_1 /ASSEMBLY_ACC=CAM_ASM_000343 /TAXON_ID=268821 /ORGANISM="Scrippsiella Hangoei, Strain SHTV-5" /LENGTH=90 /DNA_ID=CAMNT_0051106579 /DNA_START=269 /DNA_END=537 /DNA_ORIENTATION=+